MKLSVMQENLARGLVGRSRAVSSRSTLPVLANVLLRTEDAGLKLTATNLEIGITYWVPARSRPTARRPCRRACSTDLVSSLPGGRAGRPRAPGPRHAPHARRPLRDPRQGHRRRRVPDDPDRRRAPDDPDRPEGPQAGARGDGLRRRERRGAPDPHRRACPVRGRHADARRRGQLPDRGQDDPDILDPVEDDQRRHPGAGARRSSARILADTDDPVELVLAQAPQPDAVPPRGRRPRQPPDRRPVPELPAGAAGGHATRAESRPRGAAPRRPARRR